MMTFCNGEVVAMGHTKIEDQPGAGLTYDPTCHTCQRWVGAGSIGAENKQDFVTVAFLEVDQSIRACKNHIAKYMLHTSDLSGIFAAIR